MARTAKEWKAIEHFIAQNPGAKPQMSTPGSVRFLMSDGNIIEPTSGGLISDYNKFKETAKKNKNQELA